jgi:hypothetical protein
MGASALHKAGPMICDHQCDGCKQEQQKPDGSDARVCEQSWGQSRAVVHVGPSE